MKRGAFCLALMGWPLLGADDIPAKAAVALYVNFEQDISPAATAILQTELHAILSPVGFPFEWRDAGDNAKEEWAELAVVTFKGHCDVEDLDRTKRFAGGALGWTHVSNGRILPFIDIDCDRIGSFLDTKLFEFPSKARQMLLERAVARVVAHELYHVFTRIAGHGTWGVAKAEFTPDELLSGRFQFQSGEARILRKKAAQALLQLEQAQGLAALAAHPASH